MRISIEITNRQAELLKQFATSNNMATRDPIVQIINNDTKLPVAYFFTVEEARRVFKLRRYAYTNHSIYLDAPGEGTEDSDWTHFYQLLKYIATNICNVQETTP
ncbi:MAG: hypothetical protein WC725_04915 [Patescibacteria group bacterium]|jgi:hypothetical protein